MRSLMIALVLFAGCQSRHAAKAPDPVAQAERAPPDSEKAPDPVAQAERAPPDSETIRTAYEEAFNQGYNRFMEQMGMPNKAWSWDWEYTKSTKAETELDEKSEEVMEAKSRGYADGYHAATKSTVCPGCPRHTDQRGSR